MGAAAFGAMRRVYGAVDFSMSDLHVLRTDDVVQIHLECANGRDEANVIKKKCVGNAWQCR